MEPSDSFDGGGKIIEKNDVRIHIAKEIVGGIALALGKQITDQRRAFYVASDFGEVTHAKLTSDFGGAFIRPQQNDFRFDGEPCPAHDGIALNYVDMAAKGLWHGKNGDHLSGSSCQVLPVR